jgi:hypothetical protein
MIDALPHQSCLPDIYAALGCGDDDQEHRQDKSAPIGRRMALAIICAIVGTVVPIMAIEKIGEKHATILTCVIWAGVVLNAYGLFMWWLTFAYPPSWEWIL